MANSGSASGRYSGRTQYELLLTVWRHDVSGLSTRWAWQLDAIKHSGTGYYTTDAFGWSVWVEGENWTGARALDFRNTSRITIASGVTGWKGHGSDGSLLVDFSASHSGTTTFGSASVAGSFWADPLPTVPAAPLPLGIDQITATSLRYRFSGQGGGPVSSWQYEIAAREDFAGSVIGASSGTSVIDGLTPGAVYWLRSRGIGPYGVGPWSDVISARLLLQAPELVSWTQTPAGEMVAAWTPPVPADGLAGYRLQIARDAGFTSGVQLLDLDAASTQHVVAGGVGGRTYHARVAARNAAGYSEYSSARQLMLVLDAGDLDGWQRITPTPPALAYFTAEGIRRGTLAGSSALVLETVATGPAELHPDETGLQRTVTGLIPGQAYRFTANAALLPDAAPVVQSYRLAVPGEGSAPAVTVTAAGVSLGGLEFVADSSTVTLAILAADAPTVPAAADEIERVAFYGIRLLQLVTDYPVRLRSTVYESSLANHFDLACNSVGASWYVGKDGVTRFRLPGAALPVSATFTDEPDAGALHYVNPAVSYDTRGMVNRLDVTNYGVDDDGENEQNDELVVTAEDSIAAFGVRSARLETNLYADAPYDESLHDRLSALLAGAAAPSMFVSALRWNAQEDLAAANELDVGQRIRVRFNGTDQDSQIVSLQHDITPRRWMTTLTLRRL